jgi:hypothetical protein
MRKGQSLVEAIVAVSLFTLTVSGLVFLVAEGFRGGSADILKANALAYAREGLEAASSIREQSWLNLAAGTYGLVRTSGKWEFSGSSDASGGLSRQVVIENVQRNAQGDIASSGSVDKLTKKVTVSVTWTDASGSSQTISLSSFFSNFSPKSWAQTDWSGGKGQAVWSDPAKYGTDDGNIDSSAAGTIKLRTL